MGFDGLIAAMAAANPAAPAGVNAWAFGSNVQADLAAYAYRGNVFIALDASSPAALAASYNAAMKNLDAARQDRYTTAIDVLEVQILANMEAALAAVGADFATISAWQQTWRAEQQGRKNLKATYAHGVYQRPIAGTPIAAYPGLSVDGTYYGIGNNIHNDPSLLQQAFNAVIGAQINIVTGGTINLTSKSFQQDVTNTVGKIEVAVGTPILAAVGASQLAQAAKAGSVSTPSVNAPAVAGVGTIQQGLRGLLGDVLKPIYNGLAAFKL